MDDEIFHRIINERIKPNADLVSNILYDGDIAIVVFEPNAEGRRFLQNCGWDGTASVFRMCEAARLDGVRYFELEGDIPMKDWFDRESYDRIFVLIGDDGVPLNFDPATGYSIAPDAEDENWVS